MTESHLTVTCLLSGLGDRAAVQCVLEQYGLHADGAGRELVAHGSVHGVLARMRSVDIESHLTGRIEDGVPGTRVMRIKATFQSS